MTNQPHDNHYSTIDESRRREFEAARMQGAAEDLDTFLPSAADPRYLPTMEELVHIDLEFGWRSFGGAAINGNNGDNVNAADTKTSAEPVSPVEPATGPIVENYLQKFPALNQPEIVRRLVQQEYLVRQKFGDKPPASEYVQRFPEIIHSADELSSHVQPLLDSWNEAEGSFAAGGRIDRYELTREQGRGGFGLVWQADDRKLGRQVALKQLNDQLAQQADYRRRFITEARIAAKLEHPGIVPVYDMGNIGTDTPFYTMKLVGGETLFDAINKFHALPRKSSERAVEQSRLLGVFLAVIRTMEYAHAHRVIHRDLKPQNIIVGEFGETIILDWGLAKELETQDSPLDTTVGQVLSNDDALETQPGTVHGTPHYMSPEQARGNIEDVDERSDIYSLGVMLFQLLTGTFPLAGRSTQDVLSKVRNENPSPPRSVDPNIPKPLEAICLKAMAKNRDARYPEIKPLREDMERYLADEPVSVLPEGVITRFSRWCRRHKTTVTATVVAAFILLSAGVVGFIQNERAQHREEQNAAKIQNQELKLIQQREERLAGLRLSAEVYQQSAITNLQAGDFATAANLFDDTLANLPEEPELAELRTALLGQQERAHRLVKFRDGSYRIWFTAGEERHAEAVRIAKRTLAEFGVYEQETWWENLPTQDLTNKQQTRLNEEIHEIMLLRAALLAKDVLFQPDSPEMKPVCQEIMQILTRAHAYKRTNFGELLENFCNWQLGNWTKLRWLRNVEPEEASDYLLFGIVYWHIAQNPQGDATQTFLRLIKVIPGAPDITDPWHKSYTYLRKAVELQPDRYWNHFVLGWILYEAGDYFHAEVAFNACLALNPEQPHVHMARGSAICMAGRFLNDADMIADGDAEIQQALELAPHDMFVNNQYGICLIALGRYEAAAEYLRHRDEVDENMQLINEFVEQQYKNSIDDFKSDVPAIKAYWATRFYLAGKTQLARAAAEELVVLDASHPVGFSVRGSCKLQDEQWKSAVQDYEKAMELDSEYYLAALGKAECLEAMENYDAAVKAYEHAANVADVNWQQRNALEGQLRTLEKLDRKDDAAVIAAIKQDLDDVLAKIEAGFN